MMIEENNLISEKSVLADTMNQYCTSITKTTESKKFLQLKNLEDIINYYHNHISIEKIVPQTTHTPISLIKSNEKL